jgi:hypothetical protein
MRFDEFDQYSENMLMAQYDVSDIISHELMKGEVREDFLISTLESCSDPKPILVKGTISDGVLDAGQLDIILCRSHAHIRRMGTQCYVEKNDCLCVIEVKGNCTGKDLKKAEQKARVIRDMRGENTPLYGVICYKAALEEKTILNRFGYTFEAASGTFFDAASIPHEDPDNWRNLEYPTLDFFGCLEEDKKIYLRKYERPDGVCRFIRIMEYPLIKHIFQLVRSLNRGAV